MKRGRASPISDKAECYRYKHKYCFHPLTVSFFYPLKLFLKSLSLPLFHPAFMSVLFISFLVEVSASPCLPTTKAARNNLLILSTLLCRLWFCVSLLMGLISKTQSNIPARSN